MKNWVRNNIRKIFFWVSLIFAANLVLLGIISFPQNRGKLAVHFFNIGQGDSIYMRLPTGKDILIDGGPDKTILSKLGRVMPFYDKEIDLIVLTHPHADHITGLLEVLKNYKVHQVWTSGVVHYDYANKEFLELIKNFGIELENPKAGFQEIFGDVNLLVLHPEDDLRAPGGIDGDPDGLNDTSIVLKASHGENDFLLTGDITTEVERKLAETGPGIDVEVLKVSHHGSKFSSNQKFIEQTSPEFAVIQVGASNRFGHPAYRTLKTLEKAGAKILRTDLDGDIKFVSDGKNLKVKISK